MAIRTALLTSRNINLDTDFSKYIESVTNAGIIEGFNVTASSVSVGIAWVPCTRTNGETIYSLVQNYSPVSISGNGHVVIKIPQSIVDNGGGNEDGTGIATIEVVATLPTANYLELANISGGTVTKVAPTIKKLGQLNTEIQSLFGRMTNAENRIEALEEAGAIDHLEESGIVGELYSLTDTLFVQQAPTLINSTLEANVGDVAANTEIHIQAIGSGVASNQLKLKVKMGGSPTTNLYCEVRKGVQVTVTANKEAYWYGDSNEIIATGNVAYTAISNEWQEITFNLDSSFGGVKGEKLDVVVYQAGKIVNASNYYILACDSTQYSEAFSYVSVNGSTRTRSNLMPYLSSTGFVQSLLSKVGEILNKGNFAYNTQQTMAAPVNTSNPDRTNYPNGGATYMEITAPYNGDYTITVNATNDHAGSNTTGCRIVLFINDIERTNGEFNQSYTNITWSPVLKNINAGDKITVKIYTGYNNGSYYNKITANSGSITCPINLVKTGYRDMPREIKNIGEFTTCTLYGIHTDGVYYGGVMLEKTTTITAGSISPSSFVGYIKVNFNGEIIKIPYYKN